ncbi:MAG: cheD [Anaerosporomusa subterranea]|nr:cheD [Anaerosporomusa subterranea]
MAHIMLPDSKQARSSENPAKFADTAIPLMINDMIKLGASKLRLRAKIAGGAQMFTFSNLTDIMRIGERNAESVRIVLKALDISIIADDTGGNYGRTVELKLDSGGFRIKTIDKGEKEL